jgi:hypothetical protein
VTVPRPVLTLAAYVRAAGATPAETVALLARAWTETGGRAIRSPAGAADDRGGGAWGPWQLLASTARGLGYDASRWVHPSADLAEAATAALAYLRSRQPDSTDPAEVAAWWTSHSTAAGRLLRTPYRVRLAGGRVVVVTAADVRRKFELEAARQRAVAHALACPDPPAPNVALLLLLVAALGAFA